MEGDRPTTTPEEVRCARCNSILAEGQDREATDDGVFCLTCFEQLRDQVRLDLQAKGENINYPMAVVGAVLGGAVGVVCWWGFTVVTQIVFGVVAVVIGWTVGKGTTILAGHKRSQGLQILSALVSGISYFYASYLVNRTLVWRAVAEQGEEVVLPLVPSLQLFVDVVGLDFGIMDLVFLAIVLYEAWKIPAPIQLAG